MALVAAGLVSALAAHARHGRSLDHGSEKALRLHGIVSIAAWLAAIACGRLIAFMA